MPQLADNYAANPTGAMVTIKCSPWYVEGRAMLLGDAAHAIVPFFGQGINCGFEDCTYLVGLLDQHGADWKRVFAEFEKERKVNTDAIADMALENFTEMRDRVGDSRFLFRKKSSWRWKNAILGCLSQNMPWSLFIGFPILSLWLEAWFRIEC